MLRCTLLGFMRKNRCVATCKLDLRVVDPMVGTPGHSRVMPPGENTRQAYLMALCETTLAIHGQTPCLQGNSKPDLPTTSSTQAAQ